MGKLTVSCKTVFSAAFLATLVVFAPPLAWKALHVNRADKLAEQFPMKRIFIELNGGAHRLVGRRWCNSVYRSPEGSLLSELKGRGGTSVIEGRAVEFKRWLEARGVKYVYVQTPAKIDMAGSMLPAGFVHRGNGRADALLAGLAGSGVQVIDLRAELTATPQDVVGNFYAGDHHWNNDAVFRVFRSLAAEIARTCGDGPGSVEPVVSEKAWKREVWPQCFMGTKTRRTGRIFGGLDDLAVYTPRFVTDMSIEIPGKGVRLSGDFRKTVMRHAGKIHEGGTDGFGRDAYSLLYIGGTYGVVRHENPGAPLKRRVMIVGDSFARPLEAFLSTAVTDLMVLDQRRFAPGETVAGFVESFKPDLVLQLCNPSAFGADALLGTKKHRAVLFEYGNLE